MNVIDRMRLLRIEQAESELMQIVRQEARTMRLIGVLLVSIVTVMMPLAAAVAYLLTR